jgi:hypothetical protein
VSISYSARIVVGARKKDFKDTEALEKLLDEGDLDQFPYCYDCTADDIIVGIELFDSGGYSWITLPQGDKLITKVLYTQNTFKVLTNLPGNIYLTTVGQ